LLSPFDSLLWDRSRLLRLFQVTYRLEAYVPAPNRVVGYYAMPVLSKERLVGLVDPKRSGDILRARHVVIYDHNAIDEIVQALREAATWVGCEDIAVDRVTPISATAAFLAALQH
jgi:hypothetical protein